MRLFLAFVPPPSIRQTLLGTMHALPGARWQSDAQLHVTLRFIGDVDRHCADALMLALRHERFARIEALLDGFGHFERRGRVDQLWAGLGPREPLNALHAKLDRLCVGIGLEPEGRRYVPHITLARLARSTAPSPEQLAGWLSAQPPLPSDTFVFDRLVLMESHMGRDGSMYEPVFEIGMG
ncbi:RNA 2',3'-cyclic phosphodiesterase [Blastomonas aquatica]|uniref:RNA 2',3'-cyclic phosphodiesterase n=1 Tax=Blastomonas aquatica TaxID=1510276 RepID=A0ABQ1JK09_9SPHN|nr:RNA 2',3'-cyclic phosphodiesterase [Blastomonas aquatica]GGB70423.1 RNA 2',3'-cyclic phosphodiesterase [Blastomonas aquatica]